MKAIALAAGLTIAATWGADACQSPEAVNIRNGFKTAQDWLGLSEQERRTYLQGFIDGIFISRFVGSEESCIDLLYACIAEMNDLQMAAIITKFINDHPERWHLGVHSQAYPALFASCIK